MLTASVFVIESSLGNKGICSTPFLNFPRIKERTIKIVYLPNVRIQIICKKNFNVLRIS
jgi:hypothetical protein